jgi:hypothetical protein
LLIERGRNGDVSEAVALLESSLAAARQHGYKEANQIEGIIRKTGSRVNAMKP